MTFFLSRIINIFFFYFLSNLALHYHASCLHFWNSVLKLIILFYASQRDERKYLLTIRKTIKRFTYLYKYKRKRNSKIPKRIKNLCNISEYIFFSSIISPLFISQILIRNLHSTIAIFLSFMFHGKLRGRQR